MKIYVASSWRNEYYHAVVNELRNNGHEVYDFRNPPKRTGFSWSQIDRNWQNWSTEQYIDALTHPIAEAGFQSDFQAMQWADACVMVLPCGRSANTEAGWMKGAGKPVFVYQPICQEPELMYKIYDGVYADIPAIVDALGSLEADIPAIVDALGPLEKESFKCLGCGCKVPAGFSMRTPNYCFLCDPNITLNELLFMRPGYNSQ